MDDFHVEFDCFLGGFGWEILAKVFTLCIYNCVCMCAFACSQFFPKFYIQPTRTICLDASMVLPFRSLSTDLFI